MHQKVSFRKIRSFLLRTIFIVIFAAVIVLVIAFARGYRLDINKKALLPTGILAISSSPKAAKVYLNGDLKGVTDLNLTLAPGTYDIEIRKDGYTSYSTKIALKGELVQSVDPVLFPINPSLSPLTNLGVVKAIPVDQSNKIILLAQNNPEGKDGIYLFDSSNRPLSFFPPLTTIFLKKNLPSGVDLDKTKVYFSYDFKQAIFDFYIFDNLTISYLFSLDSSNQEPFDVTSSKDSLLQAWQQEKLADTRKIMESFPAEIQKVASDSFDIVSFSPDQTKILYRAKTKIVVPLIINPPLIASDQTVEERILSKGSAYVYDLKEDKNFKLGDPKFNTDSLEWYPDSQHFVLLENKKISVFDYDGKNKQVVYSGPIEQSFFTVNSAGEILILANLNSQSNKLPDLYQVGIR